MRHTSSNDTSCTATLCRKFFVEFPVHRKVISSNAFWSNTTLSRIFPSSKYIVDAMLCSVLFCIHILSDLSVSKPTPTLFFEQLIAGQAPKANIEKLNVLMPVLIELFKTVRTVRCSVMTCDKYF